MKISFLLAALIFICSCSEKFQENQNSQNTPTHQFLQLHSGKQIKVNRKGRLDFPNGQNSVFIVDYLTEIPIKDIETLNKEANEIWETIQPDVEQSGLTSAVIRANSFEKRYVGFGYSKQENDEWYLKVDFAQY